MQRRAHDRVQTQLEAKFYCGTKVNFGVITNISKNGLFISTNVNFPVNINFDLLIPSNDELITIPVKISRLARSNGECSGIGVEVIDPPQKYLDYVSQLMAGPNSAV
jgi:hypothetical protein